MDTLNPGRSKNQKALDAEARKRAEENRRWVESMTVKTRVEYFATSDQFFAITPEMCRISTEDIELKYSLDSKLQIEPISFIVILNI